MIYVRHTPRDIGVYRYPDRRTTNKLAVKMNVSLLNILYYVRYYSNDLSNRQSKFSSHSLHILPFSEPILELQMVNNSTQVNQRILWAIFGDRFIGKPSGLRHVKVVPLEQTPPVT